MHEIVAPRGVGRARRIDRALRERLLQLPSGEDPQTGLTIRNKAQHKDKLLGKYFAQLGRLFRPGHTVHIMMDATRIGGEETFMLAMWCPKTRVAAWLPPQAGADVSVGYVPLQFVQTAAVRAYLQRLSVCTVDLDSMRSHCRCCTVSSWVPALFYV